MPYNNGYYGQKPPKPPKDRRKLGLIFLIIGISCLVIGITMFIVVKRKIDGIPADEQEVAYYGTMFSNALNMIKLTASVM